MARPKGSKDPKPEIERKIEIACKRISVKGTQYLEEMIDKALDPNTPPNEKPELRWVLMAIKEAMDRGLGKPKQQIDQNINMEGGDALLEAIRQGQKRIEKTISAVTNLSSTVTNAEVPFTPTNH